MVALTSGYSSYAAFSSYHQKGGNPDHIPVAGPEILPWLIP